MPARALEELRRVRGRVEAQQCPQRGDRLPLRAPSARARCMAGVRRRGGSSAALLRGDKEMEKR